MNKEIVFDEKRIQQRIQTAFEEMDETKNSAYDISFHMTDWISDVNELVKVYSNIDKLDNDEITHFIYKFLAHVPNHLNAAMKLSGMGKVEDIFNVGILEE